MVRHTQAIDYRNLLIQMCHQRLPPSRIVKKSVGRVHQWPDSQCHLHHLMGRGHTLKVPKVSNTEKVYLVRIVCNLRAYRIPGIGGFLSFWKTNRTSATSAMR